jgi:hypothetical protein
MRNSTIAILVPAIFAVACDDKSSANQGPPRDLRPLSIRVEGPAELTTSAEVQFTAIQTWTDGSSRDVTARAQWTSSNPLVLSVTAGLAKALAFGEAGLLAETDGLVSQPKSVRIAPRVGELDGIYTLTIGGGTACNGSTLPPELSLRTYTAVVRQRSLRLEGEIRNVGTFGGQIFNPQVRFFFSSALPFGRRAERASATDTSTGGIRLVSFRKSAYSGPVSGLIETLASSNRLVITGEAITTMAPSGFAGTLFGSISLYEPSRNGLIGVCQSTSHGFALVRQ